MSFHTSQTCRYLDLDANRESGATYLLIVSVSSLPVSVSVALELELEGEEGQNQNQNLSLLSLSVVYREVCSHTQILQPYHAESKDTVASITSRV